MEEGVDVVIILGVMFEVEEEVEVVGPGAAAW